MVGGGIPYLLHLFSAGTMSGLTLCGTGVWGFVLLMVFFALEKLFNFKRFHLSIAVVSACAKSVLCSESLFPTFSSIRFGILGFVLRSSST